MLMVYTYLAYLTVSVAVTMWVGHTLHKNGRVFLLDALLGNEKLADSINHLLLVGFYLVNLGFVTMFLRIGGKVRDLQEAIEYLSTKQGIVLLVLGVMHFFNLFVLSRMRRRGLRHAVPAVPRAYDDVDEGELRTRAVPLD
jgi:cytochrome c biogenesis protein CcdA